jgi:hypothetical protein
MLTAASPERRRLINLRHWSPPFSGSRRAVHGQFRPHPSNHEISTTRVPRGRESLIKPRTTSDIVLASKDQHKCRRLGELIAMVLAEGVLPAAWRCLGESRDQVAELLDIREIAQRLLTKAKELLQKHGYLTPVGLILSETWELEALDLDGRDKAVRSQRIRDFRHKARGATAVASFMIHEATYQIFEPLRLPPGETGEMPVGWIEDGQPHDCLDLRIEVPGQEPTSITVPFRRCENGKIGFGEQWEGPNDFKGPVPPRSAVEEGLKN